MDMNKYIFVMKMRGYNVFEGIFDNEQDVISEFQIDKDELNSAFVLYATYDIDGYEGSAFVLFQRDGQLYEVHGSHCSCYGLEGQWSPEETTADALMHCIKNGQLGRNYDGTDVFGQRLLDMIVAQA